MKIDVFCHILPGKYKEALEKRLPEDHVERISINSLPAIFDLDARFRVMDKFDDLMQVITLNLPFVGQVASGQEAVDLAKLANDAMAELVLKHPDRFAAAIASLPLDDIDATLEEIDRCVNDLKLRGIQLGTTVNGKYLDSPEFMPLYEKMSSYNLPIFIHPEGSDQYEEYRISRVFGWLYKTTMAMTRLVFGGVLERYPNLKVVTHHCGAMVPYLEQRIIALYDQNEMIRRAKYTQGLTKHPIDYFKMFYLDTAIVGNTPALMCGYAFCGPDHMVFGTDAPHDQQQGARSLRQTIQAIEQMNISDEDKKKIFEDNARKLMRLPI